MYRKYCIYHEISLYYLVNKTFILFITHIYRYDLMIPLIFIKNFDCFLSRPTYYLYNKTKGGVGGSVGRGPCVAGTSDLRPRGSGRERRARAAGERRARAAGERGEPAQQSSLRAFWR